MKRACMAVSIVFWALSGPMYAQQNVGTVTGTVRDQSGAIVRGVSVVAREAATDSTTPTVSNDLGIYTFPRLAIGTYSMTASAVGFKTVSANAVRVISGATTTLDVRLEVGTTSQTVQVTSTLPVIDATSTSTGTTRVNEEIADLPLQVAGSARNAEQFMRSVSGVNIDLSDADIIQTERAVVSGVGDGTPYHSYTSYSIDGVGVSGSMGQQLRDDSAPIPETIAEFHLSNNLNAEYGWSQGTALEFVTKSGTNRFHGSAFEFFRNSVLDARNYFATTVSPYRQNEFGAVLGGPIVKDKVFFFGSYDGWRIRSTAEGVTASIPTDKMKSGDFSEWLGAQTGTDVLGRPIYQGEIYDPNTTRPDGQGGFIRDPFPGNIIPANRLSSLSMNLQTGYPDPTTPGVANNWAGPSAPSPQGLDKTTIKVDDQFGANYLSIGWQELHHQEVYGGMFAPTISDTYSVVGHEYHIEINYHRSIRPNLLFGLRTGVTRNPRDIGTSHLPSANFGLASGLTGTWTPETPGTTIANDTGFGGPFRLIHDAYFNLPVLLDLTWTKGRHNFKFGTQFLSQNAVDTIQIDGSGAYSFQTTETGLPGSPLTGVGYASYLLGEVDNGTLLFFASNKSTGENWSFYAQDDWRVTSKLTVNYGLRWDFFVPTHEIHDRYSSFDPTIPNAGAGGLLGALTFWGTGPGRDGRHNLLDYYYGNWGPRVGIAYAWDPKTITRAYYGITYVPIISDIALATQIPNDGWGSTLTEVSPNGGVTPAFNWSNGWPTALPHLPTINPTLDNGGSISYVSPHLDRKGPMTQSIGLAFQRELPANISLTAEYVGKLTHRLDEPDPLNYLDPKYLSLGFLLDDDINSPAARAPNAFFPNGIPIPYPGFVGSVQQALYAYPQYPNGVTAVDAKTLSSSYHSLQVNGQKRFGQGLTMLVAYAFSKNIYLTPGVSPSCCALFSPYPRIHNFQYLDRPETLGVSFVYELPVGRTKRYLSDAKGPLNVLVGGWAVMGFSNYYAGQPISIGADFTGQPVRTSTSCSSYNPNNPSSVYLNLKAFTPAPVFALPNANQLTNVRTCGYENENLSVRKRFQVSEGVNMEFSGEFYNAFNRHNWFGLGTSIADPTAFGRYSSTTDARSVQLHFKIGF